jgi:hypothetical protein
MLLDRPPARKLPRGWRQIAERYAKGPLKELEKAGKIGSQVHALVEGTLRREMCQEAGPSPPITDKAMWAFIVWEEWRKWIRLKPILIEQMV